VWVDARADLTSFVETELDTGHVTSANLFGTPKGADEFGTAVTKPGSAGNVSIIPIPRRPSITISTPCWPRLPLGPPRRTDRGYRGHPAVG
jgi:hypothetical protein